MGREKEWLNFSEKVHEHVTKYCIPQYGDMPDDYMSKAELSDIKTSLERYVKRMGTNARGPVEEMRDLLKIAHYAAIYWGKIVDKKIITTEIKVKSPEDVAKYQTAVKDLFDNGYEIKVNIIASR